jgi:hypothetical protein
MAVGSHDSSVVGEIAGGEVFQCHGKEGGSEAEECNGENTSEGSEWSVNCVPGPGGRAQCSASITCPDGSSEHCEAGGTDVDAFAGNNVLEGQGPDPKVFLVCRENGQETKVFVRD